ncbi:RING/U-box superfamily protein with ARM repeat domain-containing protein [Perilla frutescens var. hirtella]|nr:RING/U-box superfamily protein with ARM repeat domain-containing protein [Perilla frutescens var. frutescens]KAH6792093.1 RING/U-box superfamily protein with ARM repeat domain-containing protein [Perilla frutescens var. hirtella]
MGSGKQRWKIISFHKSPSNPIQIQRPVQIPVEFLCPLSASIMADPVIVSSGHTFERNCVHACVSLSFIPTLHGGAAADFSAVIPNLALRSTILSWCRHHHIDPPKPLDFYSAEKIVRQLSPQLPAAELTRTPSELSVVSSDESVTPRNTASRTPLPLTTRPSCYSSSSSCDIEIMSSSILLEDDDFYTKLKSSQIHEQEEALVSLRKLTRTREDTRASFCTPRILSALKSLIGSRYSSLQVNAAAVLVNLSLEKQSKVKIVRSGIVPPLIDVLRGGFSEAQDHAAGALFSLSLDDQNKTAIGVLGGLPPLLHALRSDSERTRHDSALALYHLSLVQSNRVKMIKLGAVQILLGMVKSGHMLGRVMLVLCNLAASVEGRAAMLDGGAVECFLSLLSREEFESAATQESCVAALYGLSYGGLRFKGLAKEGGAEEVLEKLEKTGSDHAKENCRRILEVMREKHEEDEDINWAELLDLNDDLTRTLSRDNGLNASSC